MSQVVGRLPFRVLTIASWWSHGKTGDGRWMQDWSIRRVGPAVIVLTRAPAIPGSIIVEGRIHDGIVEDARREAFSLGLHLVVGIRVPLDCVHCDAQKTV